MTSLRVAHLKASKTPIEDIAKITYPGQDPDRRRYRKGYENYFEKFPVLDPNDPLLNRNVDETKRIMQHLAGQISKESWLVNEQPKENGFIRTILGLESPKLKMVTNPVLGDIPEGYEEGTEIVLAKWGDGHTSPVHGHAIGYLHEEILYGKMRVNTYRRMSEDSLLVRLVGTEIVTKGTFASSYTKPGNSSSKRPALIHNFTSLGYSATLHYLPEHTRDGRDNTFIPEFFEDHYQLMLSDVTRISAKEGMYLQKGDVALVRSANVPEYGDHYIVVTGPPISKPHGMRVQDVAFSTPYNWMLNQFDPHQGLTLLKLNEQAKKAFHEFHGISVENNEVKFPNF